VSGVVWRPAESRPPLEPCAAQAHNGAVWRSDPVIPAPETGQHRVKRQSLAARPGHPAAPDPVPFLAMSGH